VARTHPGIRSGVNLALGKVTYRGVAEAFNLDYTPVERFLIDLP